MTHIHNRVSAERWRDHKVICDAKTKPPTEVEGFEHSFRVAAEGYARNLCSASTKPR